MPQLLKDLEVDRVDLVEEGCNSAAFIQLYKRKESVQMNVEDILKKLQPEHAQVLKDALTASQDSAAVLKTNLDTANALTVTHEETIASLEKTLGETKEALRVATEENVVLKEKDVCTCGGKANADKVCEDCGKKKGAAFDEAEVLKGLPKAAQDYIAKLELQTATAEGMVKKALEDAKKAEAFEKAAQFKAVPVDQKALADVILKSPAELLDMLAAINTAIEQSVLTEKGKSTSTVTSSNTAWEKINKKAEELAGTESITVQQAIAKVLKQNPELYTEYLNGGTE